MYFLLNCLMCREKERETKMMRNKIFNSTINRYVSRCTFVSCSFCFVFDSVFQHAVRLTSYFGIFQTAFWLQMVIGTIYIFYILHKFHSDILAHGCTELNTSTATRTYAFKSFWHFDIVDTNMLSLRMWVGCFVGCFFFSFSFALRYKFNNVHCLLHR